MSTNQSVPSAEKNPALIAGERAEAAVMAALEQLPAPWQAFHAVEWRLSGQYGESLGEADVVVFHPSWGLIVFEVKAGAISVQHGVWYYGSGIPLKMTPFEQARRNRFALINKLAARLGKETANELTVTHAVWFPEVIWQGGVVGTEAPSRAFILDRQSLLDAEQCLLRIFKEAKPDAKAWSKQQVQVLKDLLAPDCHQVVAVVSQLDHLSQHMFKATEAQIQAMRLLRTQKRLLLEAPAGGGKTALAVMLAREHAALGKRVLLTCFNKFLGSLLAEMVADTQGVEVLHFHELVRRKATSVGLPYVVPIDKAAQAKFFREDCVDLLLSATEMGAQTYDSIIVDEGVDFAPTWWLAMEALGAEDFSWYCFYDRQQALFHHGEDWQPPFSAIPFVLDENLRNTQPIGELSVTLGRCQPPSRYRLTEGIKPVVHLSQDFAAMAVQLRDTLRDLIRKQAIAPERIVVLAPYLHTKPGSTWSAGLSDFPLETNMAKPTPGKIRVGTIHGFKGLEADVVLLLGIDQRAAEHHDWLYVGSSRARLMLIVFALAGSLSLPASGVSS